MIACTLLLMLAGAACQDTTTPPMMDDVAETPATAPSTATTTATGGGIWISRTQLSTLPTSGAIWDGLIRDAAASPGTPAISNQDSNHDQYTMAEALVCARTGQYCAKARASVVAAIGTEQGGRWLAVGRNLTAYVIAADLLGLRADGNATSDGTRVQNWIASFLTMKLAHNNSGTPIGFPYFDSGSNASAQQGAAYAAVVAYLGDATRLQNVWNAYRRYACDPTAPSPSNINVSTGVAYHWAHDNNAPCAINPLGTSKVIPAGYPGAGTRRRLDGAIINDMRRGGYFQWTPGYTSYPWVGMEGFVPAAVILQRAGFPAFQVADQAVLRATEYLWYLRSETGNSQWFDGVRASQEVQLVNVFYGKSFPVRHPVGKGRTVGYTDWTHATWTN